MQAFHCSHRARILNHFNETDYDTLKKEKEVGGFPMMTVVRFFVAVALCIAAGAAGSEEVSKSLKQAIQDTLDGQDPPDMRDDRGLIRFLQYSSDDCTGDDYLMSSARGKYCHPTEGKVSWSIAFKLTCC